MRRRSAQPDKVPELKISPMIDLIFLLLAFVIISTMYMAEVRTIAISLPIAENTELNQQRNSIVTVKKDRTFWLEEKNMTLEEIVRTVKKRTGSDPEYSVVIRGEKDAQYRDIIRVLDSFKKADITRFGLATDQGDKNE